jgi:AcrR family transcriptional regulator
VGRPRLIDDQEILDAAREIFLERGAVATTADVARRVGISQASIFKRFATKQELFLAAMVTGRYRQDLLEQFRSQTKEAGIREALIDVGQKLIPFFRQALPLVLLSWSNRGEFGLPKSMRAGSFPPAQAAQEIVAIIEGEMKAGRIRRQDPWLVTRAFVGALQNYVLLEIVTKGELVMGPKCGSDAYVEGIVEVLWTGIAPKHRMRKRPMGHRRVGKVPGALVSKAAERSHSARSGEPNSRAPKRGENANFAARAPGGEGSPMGTSTRGTLRPFTRKASK